MYYSKELFHETREEKIKNREDLVFDTIKQYIEKNGYGPTMREIVKLTDINSTSTAYRYAQRLKAKGMINWIEGRVGTLVIVDHKKEKLCK